MPSTLFSPHKSILFSEIVSISTEGTLETNPDACTPTAVANPVVSPNPNDMQSVLLGLCLVWRNLLQNTLLISRCGGLHQFRLDLLRAVEFLRCESDTHRIAVVWCLYSNLCFLKFRTTVCTWPVQNVSRVLALITFSDGVIVSGEILSSTRAGSLKNSEAPLLKCEKLRKATRCHPSTPWHCSHTIVGSFLRFDSPRQFGKMWTQTKLFNLSRNASHKSYNFRNICWPPGRCRYRGEVKIDDLSGLSEGRSIPTEVKNKMKKKSIPTRYVLCFRGLV